MMNGSWLEEFYDRHYNIFYNTGRIHDALEAVLDQKVHY